MIDTIFRRTERVARPDDNAGKHSHRYSEHIEVRTERPGYQPRHRADVEPQ